VVLPVPTAQVCPWRTPPPKTSLNQDTNAVVASPAPPTTRRSTASHACHALLKSPPSTSTTSPPSKTLPLPINLNLLLTDIAPNHLDHFICARPPPAFPLIDTLPIRGLPVRTPRLWTSVDVSCLDPSSLSSLTFLCLSVLTRSLHSRDLLSKRFDTASPPAYYCEYLL
jgi:hypothetical protein